MFIYHRVSPANRCNAGAICCRSQSVLALKTSRHGFQSSRAGETWLQWGHVGCHVVGTGCRHCGTWIKSLWHLWPYYTAQPKKHASVAPLFHSSVTARKIVLRALSQRSKPALKVKIHQVEPLRTLDRWHQRQLSRLHADLLDVLRCVQIFLNWRTGYYCCPLLTRRSSNSSYTLASRACRKRNLCHMASTQTLLSLALQHIFPTNSWLELCEAIWCRVWDKISHQASFDSLN